VNFSFRLREQMRIIWQSVKMFVLTANGQSAWDTCGQLVWKIEESWKTDFGVDIVAINYEKCWNVWWDSAADNLLEGLKPYPESAEPSALFNGAPPRRLPDGKRQRLARSSWLPSE
jgi:hypothetical protein